MADNISIVILTYDRPDALLKTISFLQASPERLPIIVADGSNSAAAARNAETCARSGANITYLHRPSTTGGPGAVSAAEYARVLDHYFGRYGAALERVATPYVAVCADDDLLVPASAAKAAAFLDENPTYVACHGTYLAFRHTDPGIQIEFVIYDGRSIDGEEMGSRLMQLLARYEAPYYGVYRTAIQRDIVAEVSRINVGLFFELYHSSATAVRGKIKRMEGIYYLRNMGNPPHARPLEGWFHWAAANLDDLYDRYKEHRQRIIELLSSGSALQINQSNLRRAVDMTFLLFVGRQFHLESWVEEYLATAIASDGERERLRAWLDVEFGADRTSRSASAQASIWDRLGRRAKRVLRLAIGERSATLARRMLAQLRVLRAGVRPVSARHAAAPHELVRIAPALRARFSQDEWAAFARLYRASES